ncbi:CPBP family intramembrane glutamic endopeptidase [Halopseudomonas pelagia]|uniref:CPBP family intramembrane glutamic endopeptidase n=1 Tax=Halopseudomonas pelagia TaxID=553151 RepID=UPI00039E3388|nr:type II CAAX endopeptidase family protein [Halopseudomonas pelagia]|tara:strand:+ start:185245 stop:185988 length:744 start_codon:yes stop_codon:yes gene_type:complete
MIRHLALPRDSRHALDDALILARLAIAYALLALFSHHAAAQLMHWSGIRWHIDTQFLLLDALFAGLVILGSLVIGWLLTPREPWPWLFGRGLSGPGLVLAGLAASGLVLGADPLAGWLDIRLPSALEAESPRLPQAITPLLDLPRPRLLAGLFIAILWVPLAEEIVFRGWLFKALQRTRPGVWLALPVTTFIFAMMHSFYSPGGVLIIALLGALLGWLRWRYDQLALCVITHALYNGLTLLLVALDY